MPQRLVHWENSGAVSINATFLCLGRSLYSTLAEANVRSERDIDENSADMPASVIAARPSYFLTCLAPLLKLLLTAVRTTNMVSMLGGKNILRWYIDIIFSESEPELFKCSTCAVLKPEDAFPKRQRNSNSGKKGERTAVCQQCAERANIRKNPNRELALI